MAEKPKVNIIFAQKASTLITRSGEEDVILITKTEAEEPKFLIAEYLSDVDKTTYKDIYTAVNYCFGNSPKRVIISQMGYQKTVEECIGRGITNGIITSVHAESDLDISAATQIKSINEKKNCGFTVVLGGGDVTLHDMHYVQVADESYVKYYGVLGDGENALTAEEVNALYAGAIAVCGVDRALTNYTLPLIERAVPQQDLDAEDLVKKGLVYAEMMGEKPRVVSGVNTAEVGDDVTEDMQHIEVVCTMDMIRRDIIDTFVNYYRGAYKNNYDNQMLLVAAINGYLRDLGEEEVLDPEYENYAQIDVEEQRQAWLDKGNSEAAEWSDDKVRMMSFGRRVYLCADIKVCQSMEDLTMYINLV